jgi:tetratricopeptide (TPR) repeat protein
LYSPTSHRPDHQCGAALRLAGALLIVCAGLIATSPRSYAQSQSRPSPQPQPNASILDQINKAPLGARAGATVNVKVMDRETEKPLKQQAIVRLTSQSTGQVFFQTTRDSETKFTNLPVAKYLLEVGAAGYLGVHQDVEVPDVEHDVNETFTLTRDPAAVDFSLKDRTPIPSKARKQAEKGIQALEFSNFQEARKHLEAANHDYPSSSSINLLLGYVALQQKDQDRELAYLTTATKLDPGNVQAQNLLGELYYDRGDYARAAQAEEIVVASSAESLRARKVLANSYLKLREFEKARENAQWLVDHGGREAASACLVVGEALAGLQKYDAAIQNLRAYLDSEPASPAAAKIRDLINQLEIQTSQGSASGKANLGVGEPGLTGDDEATSGSAGMPTDIDAQKPTVAAGVPCPANILEATANPSKQLVDSISQFSAIEHMVHESLTPQGVPRNRETRQFNYVVSINQPAQGPLKVQEYLDAGELDLPDKIKSNGLAVLAIAFHPMFRDDFAMQCEGLGDWHGQASWMVHFRQLDNKPSRLRGYVVNGTTYPVRLKGRAWIRTDNLQIIHLETDLVQPIPEIQLMTEHTNVSYGPVQFKRGGTDLWLPMNADLYVHFAKRRFHRSESFDHFMLFATDAVEKPKLPKSDSVLDPATNPGPAVSQ